MRPLWRSVLSCVAVLAAIGLAACGNSVGGNAAATATVAKATPPQPANTKASEYVIGPGDSLSIFVYHNPDLSEPGVAVRPDGRISTPLINDIVAAGKTPTELGHELEDRLKKYIQDPIVTVIVRSFVGPENRQVKVIGEATDPQAIPYTDGMTLLDVMIATKGLTKYAAGNRAVIIRHEPDGKEETIHVHLDDLLRDGDISQNVAMRPGDTLIIPQSWF
ncbi:MAG TPA: XrtA/PEP-CTERM system exopolysaccharide export protein [Acetobacteraceae bacterium]|nr:XrtA/PEP-CTERM system exopolysaccharide export protein [Acetobacteraceae bacterium]